MMLLHLHLKLYMNLTDQVGSHALLIRALGLKTVRRVVCSTPDQGPWLKRNYSELG